MIQLKIFALICLEIVKQWYFVNPILIYSQAWHETGGFTSDVFKQNNNLFGMRKPSSRKTLAKGENLNHATFDSIHDSIKDYFYRQKYFKIVPTFDNIEYMKATVQSGYAEDIVYLTKWENVFNSQSAFVRPYLIIGALFVPCSLIVLIYFTYATIKNN